MEGTPFGRYRLVELLGRGGMGEVWRAHDTETDRVVAVKMLPPQLADDQTFVQRFRREAHAAARLRSPHVIPIHNYGEIEGRLYVDMRLIEGRDLEQVLADGPLSPARAVRIIEQVAKALHAAHKIGLVHRDVKPSNILLDDDDFAYLIDFGIARAAGETKLTATGGLIGSVHYMAPERFSSGTADARADIYALACVLYECLTGVQPFPGDTFEQQLAGHLTVDPPTPSGLNPALPEGFDEVIPRGMAKNPDQRYATTVELAHAAQDAITMPLSPLRQSAPRHNAPRSAPARARRGDQVPPMQPRAPAARQQLGDLTQPLQQSPPGWPPGTPTRHRRWLRVGIPAALLAVVVFAAIVITSQLYGKSNGPQSTQATTQHHEPTYGPQVTLPFTGLDSPWGVAVDSAGAVYVADAGDNRVLKLAAGSATQSVLPFTGLQGLMGVAVDSAGNVYATDNSSNRVLKLAAGSSTPTVLPFTGLTAPCGVAVDSVGNLYVTAVGNHQVLKLAAGSATPTVLPFTGLHGPTGIAVDSAGNLYVNDEGNNRVLKLAAG
ncbi:MAG: serine/threonine protein kinase, bacterial, partial [Mycobacterium sp.]|nr:serine/threonine protein kinase, bacterial [Mycobacterium sp.]